MNLKRAVHTSTVLLLTSSFVFLAGGSAQAFSPPRVPAPGHVYVSGGANAKMESAITAGITGKAAQTTFQETVKSSPDLLVPDLTQPVKTGGQIGTAKKVFSKASGAVATLSGVDIVYTMAVGPISKLMGTTTSGDLLCDLSLVVDPSSRCALGSGQGFQPNSDVLMGDPDTGLAGGWSFAGTSSSSTWTLTVTSISSSGVWYGTATRCKISGTPYNGRAAYSWPLQDGPNHTTISTGSINEPSEGQCITRASDGRVGGGYVVTAPDAGYSDPTTGSISGTVSQGGTGSAWYPKNHPSRGGSEPSRHWRADYKCSDGVSKTTKSTSFKETDTVYPPLPSMPCEGGSYAEQVKIWQATADAAAPDLLMYDWVIPTELQTSLQNLPAECRGTASPCTLDLLYVIDSNETVSCFSDPELCVSWYTSANRADQYKCTYGGTAVALKECALFRSTFKGSTVNDTIGDPETGSGAVPGTGAGSSPGGGSSQSGECFPTGWGALNPVEWVVKPLKCLFVPSKTYNVEQAAARISAPLAAALPPTAGLIVGNNGSCPSWKVKVKDYEKEILCDTSFGNALRAIRPILGGFMIVGAAWPFMRSAWYASVPVMHITPTATAANSK